MDISELTEILDSLRYGIKDGKRAPHKPLLILLALGELKQGRENLRFSFIEKQLTRILREFGPPRKSHHPNYPFWRLRNDGSHVVDEGLWVIDQEEEIQATVTHGEAKVSVLRNLGATGHFSNEVRNLLGRDPDTIDFAAQRLLNDHWPRTQHRRILSAVGLNWGDTKGTSKNRRDTNFRQSVLNAYKHRCAVCGFSCTLDGVSTGLEAAHIKWHCHGGPDIITNGIALCPLHHDLLDRGVFTIHAIEMATDFQILVSEIVSGSEMFDKLVTDFNGACINSPVSIDQVPHEEFLKWNFIEVFKKPARKFAVP